MKTILTTLLFFVLFSFSYSQDIIYVNLNATGANDGSSWMDAYTDLQDALPANEGDTIWVAQGVYYPDVPDGNTSASFIISNDIHLLGGFNGTETSANQRNPLLYETILSGDLNMDDLNNNFITNKDDNVRTVVNIESNISNATKIDGFIIQEGYANGASNNDEQRGGGINSSGSPKIENCFFTQNYAKAGGGAFRQNSRDGENTILDNCTFENNRANFGGGISIALAPFLINECTFEDNNTFSSSFESHGGGIYISNSEGNVQNSVFKNNFADNAGGAIFAWSTPQSNGAEVSITSSTFVSNNATGIGGGVSLVPWGSNTNYVLADCDFIDNETSQSGGGVAIQANSNSSQAFFSIEKCTFSQNNSNGGEGAFSYVASGTDTRLEIDSSFFSSNTCATYGGAFGAAINGNNAEIDITRCEFLQNEAGINGGAGGVGINSGVSNSKILLDDNIFLENNALNSTGGFGIYDGSSNAEVNITNTNFMENNTMVNGGGLLIQTEPSAINASYSINNCLFEKNTSEFRAAGIWGQLNGTNNEFEIKNCDFIENESEEDGTVLLLGDGGGTGNFLVDSCSFNSNTAKYYGAVTIINHLNSELDFIISNSAFNNNEAQEGGAIGLYTEENPQTDILIENCEIENNVATVRGGGIQISQDAGNMNVTISKTKILNNQSPKGAAIDAYVFDSSSPFPENVNVLLENTLIAGNISDEAAINLSELNNFSMVNCTVTNNSSDGIQIADQSNLTLQNTILYNTGNVEVADLTGDGTITSNGGNLLGDGAISGLNSNDLSNEIPQFVNSDDYHLTESNQNPAIDNGLDLDNLPEFDLDGNPRKFNNGCVDIGAYESMITVSAECITDVHEVLAQRFLKLSPNPATDFITMDLPTGFQGGFEANIFDTQGKLVKTQIITYGENINVQLLATGIYSIKVVNNQKVFTGKFIKS